MSPQSVERVDRYFLSVSFESNYHPNILSKIAYQ